MYEQFLKYTAVGLFSLIIDFAVYYILTRTVSFFHFHLIEAKAISFFISSIFNFFYNKRWTFGKKTPHGFAEIIKYYSVASAALAINALLMAGLLKIFMDLIAWFVAAVVTALLNFTLSRLWVFATDKEKSQSD